jgi:hypothetical protein
MFFDRINDGDYLYRHCVYRTSFRGKVFDHSKLFNIDVEESDVLIGSLAWERFLPTPQEIHPYGCRLAKKRNDKKKSEGKLDKKSRQIYCGAYALKAHSIRTLVGTELLNEVQTAEVTHLVEDGEIAHVELRIGLAAGTANVESTKTAILDRMWNASCGPLAHICDADADLEPHPNTGISVAPGGKYVDGRHYLTKLWCIVRKHICTWLWRLRQATS